MFKRTDSDEKRKPRTKLRLTRAHIRQLSGSELRSVIGGEDPPGPDNNFQWPPTQQ